MKKGKKFSSMMQEFLVLNNDEITEWFPLHNTHCLYDLMFFWPCIMNWLYINYQLDALIIIYS